MRSSCAIDWLNLTFVFVIVAGEVAEAQPKEKKWVTVYTDFGYGVIDGEKFLQQTEECAKEHALATKPILEYFKTQHASLNTKHEADLAAKKQAEKEKNEKAAAEAESAAKKDAESNEQSEKQANDSNANDNNQAAAAEEKPAQAPAAAEAANESPEETCKKLLSEIKLTEDQKASVKKIYNKIVHVKFRWGGDGYIQVRTSHNSHINWLSRLRLVKQSV